tara:strand:+ start:388 stop:1074 length:687 start_codon:yes stop_codon:yes gene_type:complete
MSKQNIDAVILAAGKGKRFNSSKPKQYVKINNKSIIDIAIEKIQKLKIFRNIYLVLDKNYNYRIPKKSPNIFIIKGGNTRTKSVFNALKAISNSKMLPKNVLIHDAARPCVNNKDINKLLNNAINLKTGLSLGYPLTNALKKINDRLIVTDNLKRTNLYMSFTPQIYNFTKLFEAYNDIIHKKIQVDDEIEAMSYFGYKIKIIRTSVDNIKLTFNDDLITIKKIMGSK